MPASMASSVRVSSLFFVLAWRRPGFVLFLLSEHSTCCGEKRARSKRFQSSEPSKGLFFTFQNTSLTLSHSPRENFRGYHGANKRDLSSVGRHPLTQKPFKRAMGSAVFVVLCAVARVLSSLKTLLKNPAALNPSRGKSDRRKRYNMLMS